MDKNDSTVKTTPLANKLIVLAAGLVSLIAIKYIASDLIAPILLAAMFSVLLMPIFSFYKKLNLSSGLSLFLTILTVILGAVGLVIALQYAFTRIQESMNLAVELVGQSAILPDDLNQYVGGFISPEIARDLIGTIITSFSGIFLYLIIIPVLAVLFVSQVDSFSEQFIGRLTESGVSLRKVRKFSESIKTYIIGRFKVNLATAIMVTLALVIFNVEYPIMWGALTLVLSFIPYIGIFLAGAGPVIIILASSGMSGALFLIGAYFVITTITENFIDPLIQGKQNRLTTASLVVGFIFWSWLFGILGAIMSAPLTVMLKTILQDYKETEWIALLMVGDYSKTPKNPRSFKRVFSKYKDKLVQSKPQAS